MTYKKVGRPKAAADKKRDKLVKLMLTANEYKMFQEKSKGFVSASDFIRTRLFYNSTLQQVQPEVFIQTLKEYLRVLVETKGIMSETLSVVRGRIATGDTSLESVFAVLLEEFKKQVKLEKEIAAYMQRMLKAGRKTSS